MTTEGGEPAAAVPAGATVVKLDDTKTAPATIVFVDANGVIDIFEHELAVNPPKGGGTWNAQRHSKLVTFLSRSISKKAKIILTPAVLEEVFHVFWRKAYANVGSACSACSAPRAREKVVRQHHAAEFSKARAASLRYLEASIAAAKKHGVAVWLGDTKDPPKDAGTKALAAFVALLDRHDEVGGKDALHIVSASLLDCTAFVSRDEGFQKVQGITVYCP